MDHAAQREQAPFPAGYEAATADQLSNLTAAVEQVWTRLYHGGTLGPHFRHAGITEAGRAELSAQTAPQDGTKLTMWHEPDGWYLERQVVMPDEDGDGVGILRETRLYPLIPDRNQRITFERGLIEPTGEVAMQEVRMVEQLPMSGDQCNSFATELGDILRAPNQPSRRVGHGFLARVGAFAHRFVQPHSR